ncbi:MAG: DUF4831 family protein [Alistipes sp.]|nr:DUF4831 family protein [Alistipes sp.]MBO7264134.1 DUF4831 family protein [Alistipes sp.]
MKRLMLIMAMVIATAVYMEASAQHIVKKRVGTYTENGAVVMSDATTTFMVKVVVEYDEFKSGPYARYAQKLLGTRASFVDRAEYRVVSADVALVDNDDHGFTVDFDKYQSYSTSEPKIQVDRVSASEKSVETAALEAAETIFKLRKARMEMITGEQGEGVFGGGLESALKEIERLESAYLELFYGRRVVNYATYSYILPVDAENTSMTVARFGADGGIVAADDLVGDIIFLNIRPTAMEYPASEEKGTVAIRYANNAEITLCLGNEVLCRRVMPVYELGETVMIVKPR